MKTVVILIVVIAGLGIVVIGGGSGTDLYRLFRYQGYSDIDAYALAALPNICSLKYEKGKPFILMDSCLAVSPELRYVYLIYAKGGHLRAERIHGTETKEKSKR